MNRLISQMVSLVTTYNDYINTGELPKKYLESGVFDQCETVGFILIRNYANRSYLNGDLVGENPVRWFKYLEKDDCLQLSLHFHSKRAQSAESQPISEHLEGTIYIEAIYKTYSNFWHCRWFTKPPPIEEYAWNVRYYLPYRFEDTVNSQPDFHAAAVKLREVLNQCMAFTMDNDFLQWSQICSKALRTLDSTEPEEFFPVTAIASSARYPLNVRRVIFASLVPFMSPQADLWRVKFKAPENELTLIRLRTDFYMALINALIASINSSIR